MTATKGEIRKEYMRKRIGLPQAEKMMMDRQMTDHFFTSVNILPVRWLHTYLPRLRSNEPDTWLLVDRLRREHPRTLIAVPRIGPGETLEHVVYDGLHQVRESGLGIPEPVGGTPADILRLNLVVCPLICADVKGHRLGYGKGYYDRFLSMLPPTCLKVGLSYFEPVDELPADPWDVTIDMLVTPRRTHMFAGAN
jgi:5-formyltetrahydrofolate cyclo-ligase